MLGTFLETTASTNIAQAMSDVGQVITMVVDGVKDVFALALEYPANLFIGVSLFGVVAGLALGFIKR